MRRLLLLGLLLSLTSAAHAQDHTERLTVALSGYHHTPTVEELHALELPDLQSALIQLALDPAALQTPRARAIEALSAFPDSATQRCAEAVLAQESNLYLLARALDLASHPALILTDPNWSLAQLETFATHPDPVLRQHVVLGLGRVRPELRHDADELLLQIAIAERNRSVRESLDTVLATEPVLRSRSLPPIERRLREEAPSE